MSLFNVYAVSLKDYSRRLIAENKTERNAEAIVQMAVMRRGVEEEIFVTEPVVSIPASQGGEDR